MKKILFSLIITILFKCAVGQGTISPLEKEVTDSVCNCLARVDMAKIDGKQQATSVLGDCFTKRMDLLMKLADEKKVDPTDAGAMRNIGIEIGKDLFYQNCAAFTKLSLKLVGKNNAIDESTGATTGKIKRIDIKGFNYIIITDDAGNEKSFIWLRQFPNSENFMDGIAKYEGKSVKIGWQDVEVYLPQAKGYYKVKEIRSIEFL